ncbi:SIS domain-containing protein [Pseudactinotalea sp. HY158]|uniref:SIS domain-containing protein n=1 Tax=Pseudactinotalea sp. HY158 TaxID=2654547 RepID=UPI00129C6FF7|nr:SIS domain-containing protein [Pseudactinotalea sp. HY158]QGH68157.1 SIS domain-containing protein [Pseudactinotalea sp. HY158]
MSDFQTDARTVLGELGETLGRIDATRIDALVAALERAGRVFVLGVGREGLAARGFAMRLMHLGFDCHWGWDDTTPNVAEGDTFLLVNGSGAIGHLDYVFEQVRAAGAQTLVVTGVPDGRTPREADLTIAIPATVYRGSGDLVTSIQPMGSLFEQATGLMFDLIVLRLAESRGLDFDALAARHRNFE